MIDQVTFQKKATELKTRVQISLNAKMSSLEPNFKAAIKANCILSGGCFASILNDEEVNDFDLWCADYRGLEIIKDQLGHYNGLDVQGKEIPIVDINPKYNDNFVDGKIVTANAVTLKNKLQFISNVIYADAKKSFDYLHCTVNYDLKNEKLYISRNQMDSILNKKLVSNAPLVVSEHRMNKFIERGWKQ